MASGCTAVDDVFSGERNFYIAYDESARTGVAPRPEEMIRDLGKTYEICNTNIKRWTLEKIADMRKLRPLLHT